MHRQLKRRKSLVTCKARKEKTNGKGMKRSITNVNSETHLVDTSPSSLIVLERKVKMLRHANRELHAEKIAHAPGSSWRQIIDVENDT